MKDKLNILNDFDGGIYSWKEHLIKPHKEIYELLIERYKLNKEETIFFDDTLKNVQSGNELLKERTKSRKVNFEDAKRMQESIEKELSKTTIPVIIIDVKEKELKRD